MPSLGIFGRGTLHALRPPVRREDSNAIEARLRERDRDQVVIGNRAVVANPYVYMIASQEAAVMEAQDPAMLLQDEQQQLLQQQLPIADDAAQHGEMPQGGAPQDGGDDDLFAALGEALDQIEGEEREQAKEYMAPVKDRLEVIPDIDTMYKSMTRSFICSTDPRLHRRPRTIVKPGQIVTAVDKSLEDLLQISLNRARHALEKRRSSDGIRATRRFG